uniref:Aa_trans domain-containing protein n=1 Tax=Angiostrongylus cantonensis TaxID=6313 RepID=A0A0K0D310_ANGCA
LGVVVNTLALRKGNSVFDPTVDSCHPEFCKYLKLMWKSDLVYQGVIVTLAFIILPSTFLKSPADFWGIVVLAMLTTVISVVSIHVGIAIDMSSCFPEVGYPEQTSGTIILSLGIFLFAFSGHFVFPTIQHDMKNPHDFTKSVVAGFLCTFSSTVAVFSLDTLVIKSIKNLVLWTDKALGVDQPCRMHHAFDFTKHRLEMIECISDLYNNSFWLTDVSSQCCYSPRQVWYQFADPGGM